MTGLADSNPNKQLGGETTGDRDAEMSRPLPAEIFADSNPSSNPQARTLFHDLLDSAFDRLTASELRAALYEAAGVLDDHGLMREFALRAEEAIIEGRGQAMEP